MQRLGYEIGIGAGHGVVEWERCCGRGSLPEFNKEYCEILLNVLKRADIKSVSDFGCGNMETYKEYINWNDTGIDYKGYDVNIGCIDGCKKRYPDLKFDTIELNELPPSDECLIIKDVLIHWFDPEIKDFFNKVFNSFEYVIYMHSTTNRGYKTRVHRHGPNSKYGIDKQYDENFFGYKCVDASLIPSDKIIFEKNIMGDSMKTFILFKRG